MNWQPSNGVITLTVVAAAAESAESTFAEHRSLLNPPASSSPPAWVMGDAIALEQLLFNLPLNSAQAMGPGGRASLIVEEWVC